MSTEFIDIERLSAKYRPGRTADFNDVELRPSQTQIVRQSSRCMDCGIPFCHACACPLAISIPEMIRAVKHGDIAKAYGLLCETSPFPEFTSRVCPALCEASCCANLSSDAVAIKQIEFFIIEEAFRRGLVESAVPNCRNAKRVAVIGAGPAGLAAAHRLNSIGYEVAVFEKRAKAGGLLRYGIPEFKLEKNIIDRRVDMLKKSGVIFEFDTDIGEDVSAAYIAKKFDAICLCIGCETPRDLNIKGRSLKNIHFALDYLGGQIRFNSGESSELEISAKGKKVLIIGGGDTGADCLGTALRQGAAETVQIEIMPEPPEQRHASTPWPEWEYKKRTSSSHLEGGRRLWSVLAKSFAGDKDGNVKKLHATNAVWEYDKSGRPLKFCEDKNGSFEIEADLVLIAMGFVGAASKGILEELNLSLDSRGNIASSKDCRTSHENIFTCADAANGASLVVKAMASAKTMADSADKFLRGA